MKIVFVDFDGTLFSHYSNRIPSSAVKAIEQMQDNGILVFICTGRSLYELDDFDLAGLKFDGIIANNGQLAYDKNGKELINTPIDGELKDFIVDFFNKKTVPITFNTISRVFCNYLDDELIRMLAEINTVAPEAKAYEGEDIYMCSAFYNNQERWNELMSIKDIANITYWHSGGVDIVPKSSTKAKAVEKIIEMYGIKQTETMAIGDSENDVNLLKYCEIGVAMGNGTNDVKEVADYVTDHIDNDGIYNICKKLNLI